MRILLLTFYYPPDLCAGSFRAASLVNALLELGGPETYIDVLTTTPNRYSAISNNAMPTEEGDRFTITRIPLPEHRSGMFDQSRSFFTFMSSVIRRTKGRKWDLVIATSSRLMTATLGAWVARRTQTPLYLDIRDLFTDTMADLLTGSFLKICLPPLRYLEKWTFRSATHINLVSAGFLPHVEKIAILENHSVFTNGIDDEFLEIDFCAVRRSDPNRLPLVVYAGNMGEGQGLHCVIPEAARILEGRARFRLIGDGGRKKQLEDALAAAGVGNVEMLDPVPRVELYRHYHEADILFLHLNDHAAFLKVLPSKLFEYGSIGKPIVAGVAGYSAEFIRKELSDAELFSPCDAEGLAAAIDRLTRSPPAIDRDAFRNKYGRRQIMTQMAAEILQDPRLAADVGNPVMVPSRSDD